MKLRSPGSRLVRPCFEYPAAAGRHADGVNGGRQLIHMLHIVVIAIFVALLLSVIVWWLVYRRFDPHDMQSHALYRLHQVLIAVIAMLAISLAIIVVLSSDPGDPDYYLFWP